MPRKPRVLLTEPVFEEVISLLQNHTDLVIGKRGEFNNAQSLASAVKNIDGLLCMLSNPVTADVINEAKNLNVIANYAVGYNNIDISATHSQGIKVANTPGVLTETTAEGTFALLLAVSRRLNEAENALRAGRFDGWHPTGFLGTELSGKSLGIVGMGRIGTAFARLARAFGMQILYHNRNRINTNTERELQARFVVNLDELVSQSDVLSLHCPLTSETHHLINEKMLRIMKPGSILLNASRGPVVDEAALAAVLHQGGIRGAGLDVYENEPQIHPDLLTAPGAVLLPHITSATYETRLKMGMLAAGAVLHVLCNLDMPCYFVED